MSLDDFLYNDNSHTFEPVVKIAPTEKKLHPRGWYIKLVTGELDGTFLNKERADKYIAEHIKSGGKKYEGAVSVFVE